MTIGTKAPFKLYHPSITKAEETLAEEGFKPRNDHPMQWSRIIEQSLETALIEIASYGRRVKITLM